MNVQVAGKSSGLILMLQKFVCSAIVAVKKRTTGMSVVSRGPNHPISEFATSHVYRLKKTRNEGDLKLRVLLIKRVRIQCYIF